MTTVELNLIKEIDRLWDPVYPHLSRHIAELYGREDGKILEIGPFCGVIFFLQRAGVGRSFSIATFPPGMGDFFRQEAKRLKVDDQMKVVETDPSLAGIQDGSTDLAIFRGALFFPSLFKVDFSAIQRILGKDGMAFIGGGFGKFTPDEVIRDIGTRSKDLNYQIGKIEVDTDQVRQKIRESHLQAKTEYISEGGLWVVMRK